MVTRITKMSSFEKQRSVPATISMFALDIVVEPVIPDGPGVLYWNDGYVLDWNDGYALDCPTLKISIVI